MVINNIIKGIQKILLIKSIPSDNLLVLIMVIFAGIILAFIMLLHDNKPLGDFEKRGIIIILFLTTMVTSGIGLFSTIRLFKSDK